MGVNWSEFLTHFSYTHRVDVPEVVLSMIVGAALIALAISLCVGAVLYVVQALAMYRIAKYRGISNPWLAWVPIGNLWILGSLSDQYGYLTCGKIQHRRVILPVLGGAATVMLIVMVQTLYRVVGDFGLYGGYISVPSPFETLICAIVIIIGAGFTIARMVYYFICLYNVYRSCDPSIAMVYLVISILFSIAAPFLLFSCRKKELGMPPRKETFSGNNFQSNPYAPGDGYPPSSYAPGSNDPTVSFSQQASCEQSQSDETTPTDTAAENQEN